MPDEMHKIEAKLVSFEIEPVVKQGSGCDDTEPSELSRADFRLSNKKGIDCIVFLVEHRVNNCI
jgi:hypothetical protein